MILHESLSSRLQRWDQRTFEQEDGANFNSFSVTCKSKVPAGVDGTSCIRFLEYLNGL